MGASNHFPVVTEPVMSEPGVDLGSLTLGGRPLQPLRTVLTRQMGAPLQLCASRFFPGVWGEGLLWATT